MNRFKLLATTLTLFAILFAQFPVQAWNSTGHRVISYIAYDQLEPEKRAAIVEIRKQHPRFEKDFIDKMPDDISESDEATKNRWIFMHASTWPDIAKGFRGADNRKYNHKVWHYINKPIFIDLASEQALSATLPTNLSTDPEDGTELKKFNAIQALKYSVNKVKDPSVSKREKAVYICWIMHLTGDKHQPLHSTALFAKKTFPKGDLGGNKIKVGGSKLHARWDGLLGTSKKYSSIAKKANEISHDPELREISEKAIEEMDYQVWINEGHRLAKSYVYAPKIIEAVQESERDGGDLGSLPQLPPAYYKKAGAVASQRAAQAGWRLAKVLEGGTNIGG